MERREDDVQALKREVELLKSLLVQEREKSNGANQRELSPTRPASPATSPSAKSPPPLLSSTTKNEQNLRSVAAVSSTVTNNTSSSGSATGQGGKSMRGNTSDQVPAPLAAEAQERSLYLQHVPVDTKRGKWWLKDRQVLSRNAPSPYDDCIAIKVRETWVWSGRTVVVDKIVTCPRPADESDDSVLKTQDDEDAEIERATRASSVRDDGRDANSRLGEARKSQEAQSADSPSRTDARQLAQEFKLQSTSSSAPADQLQDASERMEHQMAVAAKEAAMNHQ